MRIGIMTRGLSHGDTISSDAVGMWRALRAAGYDAMMFTVDGKSELPVTVFNYADLNWKLQGRNDLLIYHYRIDDVDALPALRQLSCRLALRYHGIAPSKYAAPYSTWLAQARREGMRSLARILDLPLEWIIGVSDSSVRQLDSLPGSAVPRVVIAPFHNVKTMLETAEEPATLEYLSRFSTNLLAVGRLVPDKGYELMLEALAEYLGHNRDRPHLHIVGKQDPRVSLYREHLDQMVGQLGLGDCVTFHPHVGPSALATYFRYSDLYWTTSRFEGFGMPVVEAMAFGLPVVSTTARALGETGGDAILYADTAAAMVETLSRLLSEDTFLLAQGRTGKARFQRHFTNRKIEETFLAFIGGSADRPAPAEASPIAEYLDDDWFGLPSADAVIREGLAVHDNPASISLIARDARIDFLAWLLTEGRQRSTFLNDYFSSKAFARYAAEIPVPAAASRLSAGMRLAWLASRSAQAVYPLDRADGIQGLQRWFWRQGLLQFDLHHLLGADEIRLHTAIQKAILAGAAPH